LAVKKKRSLRYIITVLIGTFIIAVILGSGTEAILRFFPLSLTWILLIIVILIGIVFDIIGIAVTAADEAPHHARAAKKVFGARQSVYLIKRADIVANFANDIVGDITGTLSGAMGATIIISVVNYYPELNSWKIVLNILILALIASCTVTGKAWGKSLAINEANRIIEFTGRIVAGLEKFTGLHLTQAPKRGGK
jgi:CBS domain containing-hemolysin-like protein